jgi:hypothetical protein
MILTFARRRCAEAPYKSRSDYVEAATNAPTGFLGVIIDGLPEQKECA